MKYFLFKAQGVDGYPNNYHHKMNKNIRQEGSTKIHPQDPL